MQRSRSEEGHHFLVELTSNDGSWSDLTDTASRARAAATRARTLGADVSFIRSVYAPESNRLFLVYRAVTEDAVLTATRAAGLQPHGVSMAIEATDGGGR